jgi:bile acid:Na+ symporter, BASS family
MELLSKAVPVAMLAFVVSSMLAVGVSLTVGQIMAPLRKANWSVSHYLQTLS